MKKIFMPAIMLISLTIMLFIKFPVSEQNILDKINNKISRHNDRKEMIHYSKQQGIEYQLDRTQSRILRLYNLSDGGSPCNRHAFEGRVVQRNFSGSGTLPNSIILQGDDGSRQLVNIDNSRINLEYLPRVALGWVTQGLQTLLNEGRKVVIGVDACGAAGRVLVLDSIMSSTDAPSVMPPVATVPPAFQACRRFPSLC